MSDRDTMIELVEAHWLPPAHGLPPSTLHAHADHALSPAIRAAHAIRACDHAVLAIEMTLAARPAPEIHAQSIYPQHQIPK